MKLAIIFIADGKIYAPMNEIVPPVCEGRVREGTGPFIFSVAVFWELSERVRG